MIDQQKREAILGVLRAGGLTYYDDREFCRCDYQVIVELLIQLIADPEITAAVKAIEERC